MAKTIIWDGNTEGLYKITRVTATNSDIYKISDSVLIPKEYATSPLADGTVRVVEKNGKGEISFQSDTRGCTPNSPFNTDNLYGTAYHETSGTPFIIFVAGDCTMPRIGADPLVNPPIGTYMPYTTYSDDSYSYVAEVTYTEMPEQEESAVTEIDPRYLMLGYLTGQKVRVLRRKLTNTEDIIDIDFTITGQLDVTYSHDESKALLGDRSVFGEQYGTGTFIVSEVCAMTYRNGHLIVEGDLYDYDTAESSETAKPESE